jgi:hypothetical protein
MLLITTKFKSKTTFKNKFIKQNTNKNNIIHKNLYINNLQQNYRIIK